MVIIRVAQGGLMRTTWDELLRHNDFVIADGAMGTMLVAAGLGDGVASEAWNLDEPDKVKAVYRAYVEAGSHIILTNTFGGNRLRLERHGLTDQAAAINRQAAEAAGEVAQAASRPVIVAGSMGPTGLTMEPYGDLTHEQAVTVFREQAEALHAGGVDVFWVETMSALEEVRAAVEACRSVAAQKPVITTMSFDMHGHTMMGVAPAQALTTLAGLGAAAVGANCGNGPDEILDAIQAMHEAGPDRVLVAKANAGLPRMVDGHPVYDATPKAMATYAKAVKARGARVIGACCGSTPDHIRAMAAALTDETG